jgi:hypothetical protein
MMEASGSDGVRCCRLHPKPFKSTIKHSREIWMTALSSFGAQFSRTYGAVQQECLRRIQAQEPRIGLAWASS